MAGISSDRSGGLQLGPLQNIAPRSQVAPITDFMEAFRQGFITVDDINKRTASSIAQGAALQTGLNAQDLQQRQIAGQAELLPAQIQNQAIAQDVQASQLAAQGAAARATIPQAQAEEARQNPATREGQLRSDYQNNLITKATQYFGEAPEILEVPSAIKTKPLPFEEWLTTTYAAPELQNDNEGTRNQYALYVQQNANPTEILEKGTPAYNQELARRIQEFEITAAAQGAQIKALPGVLEARAKAAAEGPAKTAAGLQKIQQDVIMDPAIKKYREEQGAFDKVQQLRANPNPNNVDDLSLLYSYVKILDPTSVVREGELKLANSTVPAITAAYNKVRGIWQDKNKIIDPNTRQNIFNSIDTIFTASKSSALDALTRHANAADLSGISRQAVFTPNELNLLSPGGTTAAPAPAAGSRPTLTIGQIITVPRDITTADGRIFRRGQSVKIKALDTNGNPTDIE